MEDYENKGKNIVYLDESGFEKETLRSYGYAIEAHAVWIRLIGKPRGEPMSLERVLRDFIGNWSF
jgi:hypothetical protein